MKALNRACLSWRVPRGVTVDQSVNKRGRSFWQHDLKPPPLPDLDGAVEDAALVIATATVLPVAIDEELLAVSNRDAHVAACHATGVVPFRRGGSVGNGPHDCVNLVEQALILL
jgi:hypothetical protein